MNSAILTKRSANLYHVQLTEIPIE